MAKHAWFHLGKQLSISLENSVSFENNNNTKPHRLLLPWRQKDQKPMFSRYNKLTCLEECFNVRILPNMIIQQNQQSPRIGLQISSRAPSEPHNQWRSYRDQKPWPANSGWKMGFGIRKSWCCSSNVFWSMAEIWLQTKLGIGVWGSSAPLFCCTIDLQRLHDYGRSVCSLVSALWPILSSDPLQIRHRTPTKTISRGKNPSCFLRMCCPYCPELYL